MIMEKKLKTFVFRDVILAYFIPIIMADGRPVIINSAVAVFKEMLTRIIDFQIPTVKILENLHTIMGNLPQQNIKMFLLPRWSDHLGEIATAHRTITEGTYFLRRKKYFKHVNILRYDIFKIRYIKQMIIFPVNPISSHLSNHIPSTMNHAYSFQK